jgi:hypothetical protein
MKDGEFVHYKKEKQKNGRIKSVVGTWAFVVYLCSNDWANYENYTAIRTDLNDLGKGWVDSFGDLIPETSPDHPKKYIKKKNVSA